MADKIQKLSSIVDAVAQQIVSTEHFRAGSIIRTPLVYPSGASVVVQITEHADRFFVSDMGIGSQEADMFGAANYYNKSAAALADHYGIRFDNQSFFVAEASREQLAGATTLVANCSCEATAIAAYRSTDRVFEEQSEILYKRLVNVFPKSTVDRNVEFVGSSTHKWKVATVVHHQSRIALFEPVSKNHLSVVSTAAKFHDIARLESPPNRISVVESKDTFGNFINVLSQAGSVVEFKSSNETLVRLAEAA
jgi:hypothetical protein